VIWDTIQRLLAVAAAAAFSENLVFSRAFGLGELEYDEFTPLRAVQESWLVTLMILLASVSGWGGRQLVERYFRLPIHLQAPVFLGIYTVAFLLIMGSIVLVRRHQGKENSKKRYKLHTAIAFGFLPVGVLLIVGFGTSTLAEAVIGGLGSSVGYLLASLLCWQLRERLYFSEIPKAFRGVPIFFVCLGLVSLALFGLMGHQLAL
jgi:electron transport complex protein RnfA